MKYSGYGTVLSGQGSDSRILNYLAFKSYDYEHTRSLLFQKCVVHVNLISTFLLLGWYCYNKPENIYGCSKMLSMLMKFAY